MESSQYTIENSSNPTGAQVTSGPFHDANSVSTAIMGTEKDELDGGLMVVNNKTYDLLNHHNISSFE